MVRVTPNIFVSLYIWGAYVFWATDCVAGFVLLGIWAPETKGVPMEMMEELFRGKWWMGWNAKVDLTRYERDSEELPEKDVTKLEVERV